MSTQTRTRSGLKSLVAATTAALLAAAGLAIAPTVALAAEPAKTVTGGDASWGISSYVNAASMGRPNPLPGQYVSPATFDATSRISTWGNASGTLNADGSAEFAFEGTSVNFAATGGGWLKLKDLQAELDADGNGVVSAEVSYGLAPGSYPNISFDPNQDPVRGPERIDIVNLTGNTTQAAFSGDSVTWEGLSGLWSDDFTAFLAGSTDPVIDPWAYASTITNDAADDRKPSTFSFALATQDIVEPASILGTVESASETGLVINASASNVVIPPATQNPAANQGAYVAVIAEDEVAELGSNAGAGAGAQFVPNAAIVDGSFTTEVIAEKAKLDRTKNYVVVSWIAHGFLSESSFLAQSPLEITEAQWDAVFPSTENPDNGEGENPDNGGTDLAGTGSDEDTSWTPSEDDLTDANRGDVQVPDTAVAGSTIAVIVGDQPAGTETEVYLFSDPVHLGSLTLPESGAVNVKLPAKVTGEHRVAVYSSDGEVLGWDTITITSAATAALPVTGGGIAQPALAAGLALLLALAGAVALGRGRILNH